MMRTELCNDFVGDGFLLVLPIAALLPVNLTLPALELLIFCIRTHMNRKVHFMFDAVVADKWEDPGLGCVSMPEMSSLQRQKQVRLLRSARIVCRRERGSRSAPLSKPSSTAGRVRANQHYQAHPDRTSQFPTRAVSWMGF